MTKDEQKMDEILRTQSRMDSEPEEGRKAHDRLVRRLGEAIKGQGLEERSLWGGRSTPLADFEQRVLVAALALQGDGLLTNITDKVNASSTKLSSTTAVFFTLNRLEGQGLISSRYSDQGERHFKVTEEGQRVLASAKAAAEASTKEASDALGDFA